MAGPVADGGHIVWNSTPGLLGSDDHARDPRRPRGLHAGRTSRAPRSATRSRSGSRTSRSPRARHRPATTRRWRAASTATRTAPRSARAAALEWPETRLEGIGETAMRCVACGADATPFTFTNGYTVAFDGELGVTVGRGERAEASRATPRPPPRCRTTPTQHPILTFAPHDIVGLVTRMRPFLGQLGTSPSTTIPDSHNAGDFGAFLIGAPHRFALDAAGAARAQDRRPPGHRRRTRRRDRSSAR